MKLQGLYILVFSQNEAPSGEELWHDPLVRGGIAALRDMYISNGGGWEGVSPEDAAAWARGFGASSFGDALYGGCLAALLHPSMPAAVQV